MPLSPYVMPPFPERNKQEEVLSVTQLNRYVSQVLDQQIPMLWIRGEISNFTVAASGHWYFSIKDAAATVRGVMFRGRATGVDFLPQNGMEVEVYARITLYEPRGDYQLQIDKMRRAGLGNLYEAFLYIKDKLNQEGLFALERKRTLPTFIQTIGVVTSLSAAALQDVLTVIKRRAPYIKVIVYPSLVQGREAPTTLISALQKAQERQEVDVLLLVRGGGSIEDLWAFNDEQLARVIASMPMPVVSGVGHETDFTIADFVADVRAPTPTAAAELVSVTMQSWQETLAYHRQHLIQALERHLQTFNIRLDRASTRLVSPQQRLQQFAQQRDFLQQRLLRILSSQLLPYQQQLQQLQQQLTRGLSQRILPPLSSIEQLQNRLLRVMPRYLEGQQAMLKAKSEALAAYNPRAVLKRGYAIVYDEQSRIVRQPSDVVVDQKLTVELGKGMLDVVVLAEEK